MPAMDQREEKIVDAAIRVFSRYGVKRTTMNDIANEAGLVRQTLYNAFENKDEILRATIRLHADRALEAIDGEIATTENLGERLDIVFKHLVVGPFDIMQETPHADEILEGFREAAMEEIAVAEERYKALLRELLEPYHSKIEAAGVVPEDLAEVVHTSWYGFKHKAKDKKRLLQLLDSLKGLVLMTTGG